MKLLHWLCTLLFVAVATAATRERMLKDIDILDRWYTVCGEPGRLYDQTKVLQCINFSNDDLFSAFSRLPKVDLGDDPLDDGSCSAISSALKKPFVSGKSAWDTMQKKEVVCVAKDQKTATNIETRLKRTTELWQKYLNRFYENCKGDQGHVFYAYQEWKPAGEALAAATAAFHDWKTTCPAS